MKKLFRYCLICFSIFGLHSQGYAAPVCATLEECQKAIEYGDEKTQKAAIDHLVIFGKKASPIMITCIKDTKCASTANIGKALKKMKGTSEEIVPTLFEMLNGSDYYIAQRAAEIFKISGKSLNEVVATQIERLHYTDTQARLHALRAIRLIGPSAKESVPTLLGILNETDSTIREYNETDCEIREGAVAALGDIGQNAQEAAPKLISIIGAKEDNCRVCRYGSCQDEVRDGAQHALQNILTPKTAEAAIPALIESMKFKIDPALDILRFFKLMPKSKDATRYFFREIPGLRAKYINAIGEIGPNAKDAVPALIGVLETCDESEGLDDTIPQIIVGIGQAPTGSVPALIRLRKNEHLRKDDIRPVASDILKTIAPTKEDLPELITLLKTEDCYDWKCSPICDTVEALGKLGPIAKDAVQEVIARMEKNPAIAHTAIAFFGDIGPDAKDAVPILIKTLLDKNSTLQEDVITTLGAIGPNAKEAIPHLKEIRKYSSNLRLKKTIDTSLKKIIMSNKAHKESTKSTS